MKKLFLVLVVFCTGEISVGQNLHNVDSLQHFISIGKQDTSTADAILKLAKEYTDKDNNKSKQFALQSYAFSEKINYKRGVGNASNSLGNLYEAEGMHDSSVTMFTNSIRIFEELKDKHRIAAVTYNLGSTYEDVGDYPKALNTFLKALKYDEAINDSSGIGSDFNIIGSTYYRMKKFPEAMDYYQRAYKISQSNGNKEQMAINLNNVGLVFASMNQGDKALEYYNRSLKLHQELGNILEVGMSYNSIATYYGQNKNFKKALEYFLKEKEIVAQVNDSYQMSIVLLNMGLSNVDLKNYGEAEKLLNEAAATASKNKYLLVLQGVYESQAKLYSTSGDFKKALKCHQLYVSVSDTLLNEESNKQMVEMQTKYNSEKTDKELIKKDVEINKQQADANQSAMERNGFIVGFLLVIILVFFVYKSYREKQRSNELLSQQKEIIEEKNKEVTDSIQYAKRIQDALLPSEKMIERTLNRLKKT